MGYGYLGAYLAYGFALEPMDITEKFLEVWPYSLGPFYDQGPVDAWEDLWSLGISEEERTSLLIDPTDDPRTQRAKKRHRSQFQANLEPCFQELDASLFMHPEFPRILIKPFGEDDDTRLFVCWQTCFRGGGYWTNHSNASTLSMINLPVVSAQTMLSLEQSFDAQEMQRFCATFDIPSHTPSWQTLITFGQSIY